MSDYDAMEIVTNNSEVIANMQKRIEELEQECELISELSSNQDEALSKLEQQNETQHMQLVACSVLSLCNTEDTLKQNSNVLPEYNCATIDDIVTAVKREIKLRKSNKELEQQNAELASYCENLRKQLSMAGGTIEYLEDGFPFTDACKKVKENTYKLVAKTPQQSLANIQADAIDEVADWIYDSEKNMNGEYTGACDMLNSYAKQLRAQP